MNLSGRSVVAARRVIAEAFAARAPAVAPEQIHRHAAFIEEDILPDVAEWLAHPTAGPALKNELNPIMAASGQQLDDDSDGTRMVLSMPMNQILSILGGAIDGDWLVSLLEQPAEATSSPA